MPAISRIYLDHNATSPLRPAARAAMLAGLEAANPSSVHAEGRAARALVEEARARVAALCGADARHVVFVSGASEAAATALDPAFAPAGAGPPRLLVVAGEHPCVRAGGGFDGGEIAPVGATAEGLIDLAALERALGAGRGRRTLVALQLANNETGAIQPVAAAAALARAHGARLVCDAVQAAGRIPIDLPALGADWLLLSAHKIGGPKGAGALIGARPFPSEAALIRGGGQERGARAGTENVAAIAGFGAAAAAAQAELATEPARLGALRDAIEAQIMAIAPDATIFSSAAPRLCNTSCFAVPGLGAQTLLMALDLAGVAVSSGAACSSGKVEPSALLTAMGASRDLAAGALRVSLGWSTQAQEVESFCAIFAEIVARLLARRSRSAA
ncbi:MAG: cysteine desulfurase [Methylobacteriaceae bacterium]|nr:cysteine desulfurase [Methylobacteriaceae bacterium]